MLQSLRIKNFAIVEDVDVQFNTGLNVITGETGAGKSIIVGALGLVLGERADKGMIRASEQKCSVEAVFLLSDPDAVNVVLDEFGIDSCEDCRLIVRRIVAESGSGRAFVNDCPTTVQTLKRIGKLLVDMHGPHDHQSLLDTEFQLELLDAFGHLSGPRLIYEQSYSEMKNCEARLHDLDGDDHEVAQQIDMLSFQVKEIEEAELFGVDEEKLYAEHALIGNAHRIIELANGLQDCLTEGESSTFETATQAQGLLAELSGLLPDAEEWLDEARSIAVQAQELASSIASMADRIDADPGRLQWLDDKIAVLRMLKRKYGATIEAVLEFLDTAKERLHSLETRGEQIAQISKELENAEKEARATGNVLSVARGKAAESLAKAVTEELRVLGFTVGIFSVGLENCKPRESGIDAVEFGFAPNVGEPMRPLRAIASSGEISRVMLATKTVLAAHDKIPVLVFDEIDSNVGGEMGNAVGSKLSSVAANRQVICITHLPQVAVHGGTHFVVAKEVRDGRTYTDIFPVDGDSRTEEVARMLGGKDLTSVTLEHAGEMLQNV